MTARTLFTVALGVLVGSNAFAAPPTSATEAVAALEAKYGDVTVMSASFVQTVHNPIFGDDVQSGQVVLARPTKMRWTFGEGERQFITNGDTMWIYTKADNQVIQYDGFTPSTGGAESLLSSLDALDDLFTVTMVTAQPLVLSLAPKQEGQFKEVKLSLDTDLLVDAVSIVDAFDNTTEIDFSGMVLNGAAPDSLFEFSAPAGATVVDAGSM